MKRLSPLLLLAFMGCAALQPPADQVDAVVREAVSAVRAPTADQKAALARAQQSFLDEPNPLNRLRLATLLATLPAPLRDDVRASELLESIADPGGSSTSRFGALLAAQMAERQRLSRELERLARERTSFERERQERDKREEALRQQLDALRAIERGILDREERMRSRPGGKP